MISNYICKTSSRKIDFNRNLKIEINANSNLNLRYLIGESRLNHRGEWMENRWRIDGE